MHLTLSLGGPETLVLPSGNRLLKVICASMTVRLNYWQYTICSGVKPKFKKPPCLVQYAAVPGLNKINELNIYPLQHPNQLPPSALQNRFPKFAGSENNQKSGITPSLITKSRNLHDYVHGSL